MGEEKKKVLCQRDFSSQRWLTSNQRNDPSAKTLTGRPEAGRLPLILAASCLPTLQNSVGSATACREEGSRFQLLDAKGNKHSQGGQDKRENSGMGRGNPGEEEWDPPRAACQNLQELLLGVGSQDTGSFPKLC